MLRPSGLYRAALCPGSVALEAQQPYSSSPATERGTRIHAIAETVMNGGEPSGDSGEVSIGRAFAAQAKAIMAENGFKAWATEYKMDLSWLGLDEAHGKADLVAWKGRPKIGMVLDYKTGKSEVKKPSENLQFYAYAAGLWKEKDCKRVLCVVIQEGLPPVQEWLEEADLDHAIKTVNEIAATVKRIPDVYTPTENGCRWCRAKAVCPALNKTSIAEAPSVAPVASVAAHLAELGADRGAEWLRAVKDAGKRCEAILEDAKKYLEAGNQLSGIGLKHGRSSRVWADEKAARVALTAMYDLNGGEMPLPTVAAAEKDLGEAFKGDIAELSATVMGNSTIIDWGK